jgi:hypothetical protein
MGGTHLKMHYAHSEAFSGRKIDHYKGMQMNIQIGFEALTVVAMKSSSLSDIMLCCV